MQNKLGLATERCSQTAFEGVSNQMELLGGKLDSKQAIKDLGVTLQKDPSGRLYVDTRIFKANQVFYMLRNMHLKVVKLGLYKSLVLPVLLCGFNCVAVTQRTQ